MRLILARISSSASFEKDKRVGNQPMVSKWQKSILVECRKRLGRDLTATERLFVTSRGGYIALEMIDETVKTLEGAALAEYLNSESQGG